MTTASSRLRSARRIYLGREGAPTPGDRWFSLYLIAFVTGWYVLPVAYVVGNFLDADFARSLTSAEAAPYVACGAGLLGVAALGFGRVQGPALLTPFLAHTLLSTDISRRRILLRPTLGTLMGLATVVCAAAAIGLFALTQAGAWGWGRFGDLLLASFFGGLHMGLLAFLGQRLPTPSVVVLSAAGLLFSALHLLAPGLMAASAAGWIALLWSGAQTQLISGTALLGLSAAAALIGMILLAAVPALLGRLPAQRVLAQSRRFSQARLFTSTGQINEAVELFRTKPKRRLSGRAIAHSGAHGFLTNVFLGLRQDMVTALRAPLAGLNAVVLIPSGAALLALAAPAVGHGFADSGLVVTVPAGAAGGLLLFLGTGSLTEGWRQLKREFDAAALFGWSAHSALGRRLLWPVATTAVLTMLGAVSAVAWAELENSVGAWTAGLALLALSARFLQSMRSGEIPVEYLAPTVTPGGFDLSAVKILLWLGDGALLITTGVLAVIVLPWQPQALAVVLAALVLIGLLWGWARTGHPLFAAAPQRARRC